MIWSWALRPAAERDLKKLERVAVAAVLDALDRLTDELSDQGRPVLSDVTKLKGMEDEYRLRVGRYRVRFGLEFRDVPNEDGTPRASGVVIAYHVSHRREAY